MNKPTCSMYQPKDGKPCDKQASALVQGNGLPRWACEEHMQYVVKAGGSVVKGAPRG